MPLSRVGFKILAAHSSGLALPVDFFDVVIHLNGKLGPAALPPSLEDLSPLGCSHPGAEAMPAQPATNFWLVGSFWHCILHRVLIVVSCIVFPD